MIHTTVQLEEVCENAFCIMHDSLNLNEGKERAAQYLQDKLTSTEDLSTAMSILDKEYITINYEHLEVTKNPIPSYLFGTSREAVDRFGNRFGYEIDFKNQIGYMEIEQNNIESKTLSGIQVTRETLPLLKQMLSDFEKVIK